jgi:tRNA pseudouridine13 synthase
MKMYKIKEKPEDFIVIEQANHQILNSGEFVIAKLTKTNYTLQRAIEKIARELHINQKNIGYAGLKDKIAVTTQYISIRNSNETKIKEFNAREIKDIKLEFLGYLNEPISLGDLEKNEFVITIKDCDTKPKEKKFFPNLYGKQRFSSNNIEIGKLIIQKKFKKAVELICETDSDYMYKIKEHLDKKQNDYVGALKIIPLRILKLYTNSHQSYIWNRTVKEYLEKIETEMKDKKEEYQDIEIPLVGFEELDCDIKIKKIIKKILKEENLTQRDFIIKAMPELSLEGNKRKLFARIYDFSIIEFDETKKICKINFKLDKGNYATTAIKNLFNQ